MNEKCKHIGKDGYRCGSHAFNLHKDDIDQGELCDVHYWQERALKTEDKQLTFEEFSELRFEYRMGITFDTGAQRMYRNDKHGIQVEVYTDRNKRTGEWLNEKRYWFLDFDNRKFETIDQCYVAYMEKVCGVKS